jgi:hypothetical protein
VSQHSLLTAIFVGVSIGERTVRAQALQRDAGLLFIASVTVVLPSVRRVQRKQRKIVELFLTIPGETLRDSFLRMMHR